MVVSSLSPPALEAALEHFRLIQPFLEEGVPLTQLATTYSISTRTLRYWVSRYRTYGLAGLARKPRCDRDTHRCITEDTQQIIEGLALKKVRPTSALIHRKIVTHHSTQGKRAPSYKTVYNVVKKIPPSLTTLAHEGAKIYEDTYDLLHRFEAPRPNAIWQADHTLLDIWVMHQGKLLRPWLTVIVDDYSRAVVGYSLSLRSPSALQTALALRQAIWRKSHSQWLLCGIPEVLYVDHGSDFTSRHLELVGVELKIKLLFSAVGVPRGRGKIERLFNTVNQLFLARFPGYSPTGEKIKGNYLSFEELDVAITNFVVEEYNQTPHSATKEVPSTRWAQGGVVPRMPASLEVLDLLLLTVPTTRRVHQDGIRLHHRRYIDPMLAAFVGEQVVIRYDPKDMSEVRVYLDNRFLCRAVCPELSDTFPSLDEIVHARTARKKELQKTLKARKKQCAHLEHPLPKVSSRQISSRKKTPPPSSLKRYYSDDL